jgi:hypothetical protein
LLILGVVLTLSVFPIPDAPWRYLPYIFLLFVFLGMGVSWFYLRRNKPETRQTSQTDEPVEASA